MAKNPKKRTLKNRSGIPDDFLVRYDKEIEQIFRKAVAEALRIHKLLRNPIAVVKKGKVVLIPPERIPGTLSTND